MKSHLKTLCALALALAMIACGADDDASNDDNNETSNNETSNNETSNNETSNNANNNSACPTDNPLIGSCADIALLDGCYEPDMSGTCTMRLNTEWSDGHTVVRGTSGGFFNPGSTEACMTYFYDQGSNTVTFESGDQTWVQSDNGDGTLTITCPGGDTVTYTAAESETYNECRGITCPS